LQLFVLVPYTSYQVVDLLLTALPSWSWSPGEDEDRDGRAGVDVDAGGTTAGTAAAYRHAAGQRRRLLDGGADDYRAEAFYGANSGYEDLATPRLLLGHLIGAALCSAISLRHDARIFEVSLRGTPTTGARHRAAVGGLVETRMTTLAWIKASLLLCGLWAGLRLGGTGSRYGGCLPPMWWESYASLLLSQAAQSLAALVAMLSLRGVPPVGPSSSPAGYGVMTAGASDGGTSDDGPYRCDYRDIHGNNGAHHHHHIAEEMWQARCEGCCRALAVSTCFLFGGRGIVSHARAGAEEGDRKEGRAVAVPIPPSFVGTILTLAAVLSR